MCIHKLAFDVLNSNIHARKKKHRRRSRASDFLRRPAIVSTVKHVIERQQAIEVYQRKELHMDISYIFTMLCAFTHNTNSFHT